MEMAILMRALDARNFPLSRRRLAEEVDYLRSKGLLRVFPMRADRELNDVEQAKLIQQYAAVETDADMREVLCARVTTDGIDFQEGTVSVPGIIRLDL